MYYVNKSAIAAQYDIYYKGGKESLYNKRFANQTKITLHERFLLNKHLQLAIDAATTSEVKILDFGCGDGRTMAALYLPAFAQSEYDFKIIAYDVSLVGLQELARNLMSEGFIGNKKDLSEVQNAKFTQKNVTIELALGDPTLSANDVRKLLGSQFHLVLCLFGVLSHIPGSQNRLEILKMFRQVLVKDGVTCVSLPTRTAHNKTANYFEQLREKFLSSNQAPVKHLAQEQGDIYYKINGADIYNFYHLYTMTETYSQLQEAKLDIIANGIYGMLLPSQVCKNLLYNILDFVAARILSKLIGKKIFSESIAKYLFVTAKK